MTRFSLIVAWLVATGLATVIAWQVVGAADDQISDAPMTPLVGVTTSAPATDPTSTDGVSTTAGGTVPDDGGSTSSVGSSTGSTTATSSVGSSTTSTTGAGATTTVPTTNVPTTTGVPATTSAVSDGGTVTVTGTFPRVELVAVVAAPGWSYEVRRNDGERVEVRFENQAGDSIRIRAEWDDGRLVAEIDS
jgi:hypothetical protein